MARETEQQQARRQRVFESKHAARFSEAFKLALQHLEVADLDIIIQNIIPGLQLTAKQIPVVDLVEAE